MQITVVFNGMDEFQRYMGGSAVQEAATVLTPPAPVQADPAPVQVPSAPDPAPAAPEKKVTRNDVTEKAISLMDAGKQAALQALLAKYGVVGLPALPEDKLAQFYAELEVL